MNDNYLTILKTLNSGNVQDAGKMPYFRDAQLYLKLNRYINVRYEVTDKGKAYIGNTDIIIRNFHSKGTTLCF